MTETNAIFRSVSQALHVSFLMATLPVTQKSNTQALVERLMEDAGVRKEVHRDGTLNFAGLSPMEVRGQCAMVRGAVDHHCQPLERAAIHAWFMPTVTAAKNDAILALREHCAPTFTIEGSSPRAVVLWHIHSQGRARDVCTERAIASEFVLSQSTVHRNIVAVSKVCTLLRRRGMDALEGMFLRDGVIGRDEARAA
jgi:hypothetical protein